MRKILNVVMLVVVMSSTALAQQIKTPAPSSTQTLKQTLGLTDLEVSYSRPNMKGRKIFGDLVPYNKVWRTGANQATTVSFGDTVMIGGTKIPGGKYGLLTIPGEKEWTVIITKQLDVTSPGAYKQDQDVVRVTAKTIDLPFPVETFTITTGNVTSTGCHLDLLWDKTMVVVPVETEIDAKVMAQIDDAFSKDNRPYFAAASYYLDNGKDLNKALEWFNKATEQNPTAFYMFYQKARCQAKLGKKQDAMATAQKSIELSKQANNPDYVALNEKLIASLK